MFHIFSLLHVVEEAALSESFVFECLHFHKLHSYFTSAIRHLWFIVTLQIQNIKLRNLCIIKLQIISTFICIKVKSCTRSRQATMMEAAIWAQEYLLSFNKVLCWIQKCNLNLCRTRRKSSISSVKKHSRILWTESLSLFQLNNTTVLHLFLECLRL